MMAKDKHEDWQAHDDMHTLMRADEIMKDKKRHGRARAKAKEHSEKMADVAHRAGQLAKSGHISEKQMAKLKGKKGQGGNVKDLDKTGHLATGKEGDGRHGSPNVRGVAAD